MTSRLSRFIKNYTYIWVGFFLDIVAYSIISTHDVDKTHISILNIPLFHTTVSRFLLNGYDIMGKIGKQKWQ